MLLVERFNESIVKAMADGYVEGFNTGYVQSLNDTIDEITKIRDHWQKRLEPIVQSKEQSQFNNQRKENGTATD